LVVVAEAGLGAIVVGADPPPLLLLLPAEPEAAMSALMGRRPGKKLVGIAGMGICVPRPQALISFGMVWMA
jgi:hypothetical protein